MKRIAILISLFILASCGTMNQAIRYGTYSVKQLGPRKFSVSFQGRDISKRNIVYDFALLRSAEVALKEDFGYFSIIDSKFDTIVRTDTYITGYHEETHTVIHTVSYDGETNDLPFLNRTYTPQYVSYHVTHPEVTYTILCFKEYKPRFIHDAASIVESIKKKYDIR